jgi:excisionase family DNA binding protein
VTANSELRGSQLLTVDEAAERARVSPLTIRGRIGSGELGAMKLGHGHGVNAPVRIPAEDLEAWLSASRVGPPSAAGPDEVRQSSPQAPAGDEDAS